MWPCLSALRWGPNPVQRLPLTPRNRTQLTSLRSAECDRVTVGAVALLVVNVDSESVLREGFETRHDGLSPPAGKPEGLALIQSLVGIQQAA